MIWIRNCHKIYTISDDVIKLIENTMKNWKVELTARRKFSDENPERYHPGRYTITITICDSDGVTQSHT